MGTGRQALAPVELGQKQPADPLFGDSAICSFPFACVCDSSFPTSFGVTLVPKGLNAQRLLSGCTGLDFNSSIY